VAFALSPPAREALRALFRAHRIERRYLALVRGQPRGDGGVVEAPLHEDYRDGRRRVARRGEPSRPALTRFTVLERFPGAALLELELGTGRQHQIRVHLAHLGAPLLGDARYGGPRRAGETGVPRVMLHALRLVLAHPVSGAPLSLEAPLPEDFRAVAAALVPAAAEGAPP
jgi:23S rRNA pseudouridine1911/1915/1917 synthase